MKKTLLLNADWSPLNFVSPVRALGLLFSGRAEIISTGEDLSLWKEKISSPTRSFDIPATLRLLERVSRKISMPRFRKWALFNRDGWACQYCAVDLDWQTVTIDHVFPKSRGGATSWTNCVSSCKRCNWKKGCRTPAEAGMTLRQNPTEPKMVHFWEFKNQAFWHEDWSIFFSSGVFR